MAARDERERGAVAVVNVLLLVSVASDLGASLVSAVGNGHDADDD